MKPVLNALKFIAVGWPTRVLAALAVIPLGAILVVIALISVIGIPIALALMFLPAIASLYIASELMRQAARLIWPTGAKPPGLISMGVIVVVVAFAVGLAANLKQGAAAKALLETDFVSAATFKARSVAITIEGEPGNEHRRACNELCLKLLIFGDVEKVLITGPINIEKGPVSSAKAISARFQQRGDCEKEHSFPRAGIYRADVSEKRKAAYAVYEEAQRRQDAGICLIETPARLSEADVVVAGTEIKKGKSAAAAKFDIFADTASATRLSLYRRTGGGFEEVSRRTVVRYAPLILPAAPTYVPTTGLDMRVGFARVPSYLNAKGAKGARNAQGDFAAERLGLNLGGIASEDEVR